jgi:arylsulfatase A-like enzyme
MLMWTLHACFWLSPEPPPPPDIVLVVVDTLRADHVGIDGHSRDTTPAIDALAREGHWYSRAYAQSGWTLTSMTSLLTGLYPHVHRVGRSPFDVNAFGRLETSRVTLAEAIGPAGYATAAFVNNTFMAPEFGLNQGFDVYDYEGATNDQHRSTAQTVALANTWIAAQTAPLFVLVHAMEPHMDYDPPPSTRGRFTGDGEPLVPIPFASPSQIALKDEHGRPTRPVVDYIEQLYDEEVLATDQALSVLFDTLRARDNWANTLVIVTSDHGEEFWEYGGFEHGHSLLGVLTRVPLVFGGGLARHQDVVTSVVQHVDVFRTLIALAGVSPPAETVGLNLRSKEPLPAQTAMSENTLYGPPRLSITDGQYRLELNLSEMGGQVYRVLPDGMERAVGGEEQREQGQRLEAALRTLRGGLLPVDTVSGPNVPSVEAFRQLKALGYVEGGPDPTGLEDPLESPSVPPTLSQ